MSSEAYNTNEFFNLAADVYLQLGCYNKVKKVAEKHRNELSSQEAEITFKKALACIDFRKNLTNLVLN